jgi:hypothetical protein
MSCPSAKSVMIPCQVAQLSNGDLTRRISLELHLTNEELEGRSRSTNGAVERSGRHFLWLLTRGLTARRVASITGYSVYWIGHIARRDNQHGPDGVNDQRCAVLRHHDGDHVQHRLVHGVERRGYAVTLEALSASL